MVAAAAIRIMKIAWVTYLGALSCLNATPDTSNIGPGLM